ncbi:MAG TPA: Type 1 glutamine amidotransferase-like domain-containing protein [Candidatus Paceibacterota bacterium]|jgi:peptidase E|nr:Type 1 glutamine amidotransferase-like domain-containing protein [Candidatus Paceibacterota bacterium]
MTKFILHGGFTRRDNELNRSFYEEFTSEIPDKGEILLVYFASRSHDTKEVFEEMSGKFQEHAPGKTFTFTKATHEHFLEELTRSDAVYLHGGDTDKLLEILRNYSDLKPLIEGKTVAGSSAGAYILATLGASHSEDRMREGLGLVPLRIVCHFESPEMPPTEGAITLLRNTAP